MVLINSNKGQLKNWLNRIIDKKTRFQLINTIFYNMLESLHKYFKYKFKCSINQFKMKFIHFLYRNDNYMKNIGITYNSFFENIIFDNNLYFTNLYEQIIEDCINSGIIRKLNTNAKVDFVDMIVYNIQL
jgi:hypothetical protein